MPKNLALALLAISTALSAQTISTKTAGMKHIDGYLPLDWDAKAGKLYLEIPHLDTDILYTHSLPYGTGSNDLGLDRGQISRGQLVRFQRTGPKVLLSNPTSASAPHPPIPTRSLPSANPSPSPSCTVSR